MRVNIFVNNADNQNGDDAFENEHYLHDKNSNFNYHKKEYIPRSYFRKSDNIKSFIPLLKEYTFKFDKKENIDKKLIRKFRSYIVDKYKRKEINFTINEDKNFWIMFVNETLVATLKFNDVTKGEKVEFKSFNNKYISWLFSKDQAKEYFYMFIRENFDQVFKYFVSTSSKLKGNPQQQEQLNKYLINFSSIYTNHLLPIEKISLTDSNSSKIHSSLLSPNNSTNQMNVEVNNNIQAAVHNSSITTERETYLYDSFFDSFEFKQDSNKESISSR